LIEGFSEDIEHAVFTRNGGVSNAPFNSLNVKFNIGDAREAVIENRKRIMKAMGIRNCVSAVQTHGSNVLVIDATMRKKLFGGGQATIEVSDTDGFVTNQSSVGLMLQVADCQAILFYDPAKKVLGMAHAGWKGLKHNISAAVVEEMIKLGSNPSNILVGISPSLGPEHSKFSDPLRELGLDFEPFIHDKKVDMWEYSRRQLMSLGIQERRIEIARIDTADEEEGLKFFSYRREKGKTGRFAMVAYIK
jgi:YfiH family protein